MTTTTTEPTSISEVLQGIHVHDVDTHVAEPADLWTSRVSSRWGDQVPHVAIDPANETPTWYTGDRSICRVNNGDTWVSSLYDEDTQAGAYAPIPRLAWMDKNGIFSQVLYPNVLGFHVNAFLEMDPQLRLECVQAYNDFQTEFCEPDPRRLIAITNLPWWDVDASLRELRRCREMGHRGVNFGWEFEKVGFPRLRDEHWTPLLSAIEEMGLPVSFHIGFNSNAADSTDLTSMTRFDTVALAAKFFTSNIYCISELITSELCHRHPTLKFVSVESGCGFLPYLMEALDWQFLNTNIYREYPHMLLPSEYFRRQIYGTFWFEKHVVRLIDLFPDNFMFESDYPHSTSLTPGDAYPYVRGPHETIEANLAALPDDLLVKVLQDNAARVYGLE